MEKWKHEVKMLLSSSQPSLTDIKNAIKLKKANIPKKLFKYTRVSKYSIENFKNDLVFCRTASEFHDPYDTSMRSLFDPEEETMNIVSDDYMRGLRQNGLSLNRRDLNRLKGFDFSTDEFERIIKEKDKYGVHESLLDELEKKYDDFDQTEVCTISRKLGDDFNKKVRQGYKISCFSESNTSMPMWDHYADNHYGFVIEYDFTKTESHLTHLFPVIYSAHRFNPLPYIREQKVDDSLKGFMGILASIHKALDWEYEREWRLILVDKPGQENKVMKVPTPTSIFCGSQMKPKNKAILANIAKLKGIMAYEMKLSKTDFRVLSIPLKS